MEKRPKRAAYSDNAATPAAVQSIERLASAVEQLSDDICGLMEVVEQGSLLKSLVEEVRTLRIAIDDIRAEIEWAARNLMRARDPHPGASAVTSMAADPADPRWAEKLNQLSAKDLPAADEGPVERPRYDEERPVSNNPRSQRSLWSEDSQ
jgi:hypothetical protein